MRVAGIRELKNRLSHFLQFVYEGETVLVTDRGVVVAQLAPAPRVPGLGEEPASAALDRLARLGRLRAAAGPVPSLELALPEPPPGRLDLQRVLDDVRS